VIVLFAIVFLGLLGFGLILPILPFMIEQTGASPAVITITLALYSLGQMLGAPMWGRISDLYGRRRALIATTAGAALFYVVLGFAQDLWLIMVARLLGGVMSGNISIAYAYIADTRSGTARTKAMGYMGAAFGLGFIFGPAIGGLLAGVGFEDRPFLVPALAAAFLSALATLGVAVLVEESRRPSPAKAGLTGASPGNRRWSVQTALQQLRKHPALSALIATNLVVISFWALLEAIFSIWANRVLDFSPREVALFFTYIGAVSVAVQGFAIGPVIRLFGEVAVIRGALVLQILGFISLAQTQSVVFLFVSITLLSAGSALFNPALNALVSHQSPPDRQGVILGLNQGAGSLGRVLGPMVSGAIFAAFGASAPYLVAAAGMAAGLMLFNSVSARHGLAHRARDPSG